jgi:hypothetical protein
LVRLTAAHNDGVGRRDASYQPHTTAIRDANETRTSSFRVFGCRLVRPDRAIDVYPALRRLEEAGLVASEWRCVDTGREERVYSLTPEGRRAMRAQVATWQRYVSPFDPAAIVGAARTSRLLISGSPESTTSSATGVALASAGSGSTSLWRGADAGFAWLRTP